MKCNFYIYNFLYIIILFLFPLKSQAQVKNRVELKIMYYSIVNTDLPPSTLYIKPQKSIFIWAKYDSTYTETKTKQTKPRHLQIKIFPKSNTGFFVCKYLNKDKMYSKQPSFAQSYYVREKIPSISWHIRPDKKKIAGYMAQKATGEYKGRHYIVWFTSQIPIANGPWKLGGLPGLILKVMDNSGKVKFAVKSIKQGITANDVFAKCFAKEAITWNKYKNNVIDSWQNFIKFLESKLSLESEVEVNSKFHIEKSIFVRDDK